MEARAARRAEKEKAGSEEAPVAEAEGEGPPVVESKPMDLDAVDDDPSRRHEGQLAHARIEAGEHVLGGRPLNITAATRAAAAVPATAGSRGCAAG